MYAPSRCFLGTRQCFSRALNCISAASPFSHASSLGLLGWLSAFAFMAAQDGGSCCVNSSAPESVQTYAILPLPDSRGMACTPDHRSFPRTAVQLADCWQFGETTNSLSSGRAVFHCEVTRGESLRWSVYTDCDRVELHPVCQFRPSGFLTGASDTTTTQIVMDHTGDSLNPERSFAERADGISDRQGFRSHSRPPLPDLSWRNVRRVFPQYGWEAGFSNGAFPGDRRLKLCSAPLPVLP